VINIVIFFSTAVQNRNMTACKT